MRKRKYAHSSNDNFAPDSLKENIDIIWQRKFPAKFARVSDAAALESLMMNHAVEDDIPKAHIHNLVGTALLKSDILPLNLQLVAELVPNAEYNRQKFAAITLRLASPNCTVLLFCSGRMVLTGCSSFNEAIAAALEVRKFLQVGFPCYKIQLVNVNVQNVVGNSDLNLKENETIDLDRMLAENKVYCTYLRQMFPGLIYRPNESPVVLLLFKSGKCVITGGKSLTDIIQGWRALYPKIKEYIVRK